MKRLKKILKWTGIILGALVAILLMANGWFVWTTDTRLERQLAEIRKAGDPLSMAELARPPIPPEKNAATYLRRAEADLTAIVIEAGDIFECSGFPMSIEQQKTVKAALAAHPNAIPLLEQAAACPDNAAQLDYTVSPSWELLSQEMPLFGNFRSVTRVLWARGMLLVAEGDRDEAVRTALASIRLVRNFEHNASFCGYLTAIAAREMAMAYVNLALQTGPVSKEVRDALDAELARHECMDAHVWVIKGERAHDLDDFRSFEVFPWRHFWLISRGIWNQYESDYLDAVRTFLALAHAPSTLRQDEETMQKLAAFQPDLAMQRDGINAQSLQKVIDEHSYFAKSKILCLYGMHLAVTRTRAEVRCLRVLNALQTHVPAGSDEVPKLGELGLPAETTTDPYTGEPLHVKKTPQGWLVYSVGKNFQDDGGKLDDLSDVGVGPPPLAAQPAEK